MRSKGEPISILLIDDDVREARRVLELAGEGLGHVSAKHIEPQADAVIDLRTHRYDVILMGASVPDPQWLEGLRTIRAAVPFTPIIALTNTRDDGPGFRMIAASAQDCLPREKLDATTLGRAIRSAIEHSGFEQPFPEAAFTYDLTSKSVRTPAARVTTGRKEVGEARRASEESYRLLFESNPLPLWVFDVDTLAFLAVNDAAVRHYGYSRQEFLAMTIKDIRPGEDVPKLLLDVAREESPLRDKGAWKHRKKDGTLIDVEVTAHDILFQGKQARLALAHDVTDRMQAELKYRHIFEGVPVGIYQSTLDGVLLVANHELARILGYESPQELLAATSDVRKDLYVRSGRRAELVGRLREENSVSGFESQVYRKDGTIIWISEDARAQVNEQSLLVGFEGITQDITARKDREQSNHRLLQAVEQTDDIVFMTDTTGKIVYVNPAFERIYGYSREEALNNTPRLIKGDAHDPALDTILWDTILSGRTFRGELINKTKQGRLVTVDLTVSPVYDRGMGMTGFIAVQRDITAHKIHEDERQLLEQQLYQAQKLESIGTLASGIAHDFNNVLGIILGYITLMNEHLAGDEKSLRRLRSMSGAVERCTDLVKQILIFARKSDASLQPLDVNDIVQELQKMIHETFPRTISVRTDIEEHVPLINADRTQIHQTLLNLCVNARDAMPDGGTLSIRTRHLTAGELPGHAVGANGQEFINITVSDTGTGMDEATKRRIFEPFFTTKGLGKGTGLGLAVAHGIVSAHQGYIDFQSVTGKGTSFSLFFPALSETRGSGKAHPDHDVALPGGTETILLIEDEELLAELVSASLTGKGYHVLTATDGLEGVALYQKHHQDIGLVISDLGLPKLDGMSVFNRIKKINPRVKVLITSGYMDTETKSDFLEGGACGFLQKPFVPAGVLKSVRETLDRETKQ